MMSEFRCPPLYVGCPVEVSSDPSESDKTLALVTRAMPDAADLISFSETGMPRPWFSCWHADDPRCREHPELFSEEDRGVIRLTDGEVQRREMFRRLDAIDVKLAELGSQVSILERLRPKRGRPRKALAEV